jgi:hypothetical protein
MLNIIVLIVALIGSFSTVVVAEPRDPTKNKGPALRELENRAGKNVEDVVVPTVKTPTNEGVQQSTGSASGVEQSTTTTTGGSSGH